MQIGELSRRVGVSPDRLRIWERRYGLLRPRRTVGNLRLYSPLDEARLRVMLRHLRAGLSPAQAAELTLSANLTVRPGRTSQIPEPEARAAVDELAAALDRFDGMGAQQVLERLATEYSFLAMTHHILLPYVRSLGDRWAAGHLEVAQEHFAANFVLARLLAAARGWDRGLGPRALLACAPQEQHTIGLICFGLALHGLGWQITYLGATTPLNTLRSAAEQINPDLIVIAATDLAQHRADLADHANLLADLALNWPLALGGPVASAELAGRCGGRRLTGDPLAAAETIGLDDSVGPPPGV